MTTDLINDIVKVLVQGTGPYQIRDPYDNPSDISVFVRQSAQDDFVALSINAQFTVSPQSSETTGDVFLLASTAAAYEGSELVVVRATRIEQGYKAQSGPRDKGLEAQLNRTTRALQDVELTQRRTLLAPLGDSDTPLLVDLPEEGRALVARPDGKGWTNGPQAQTKAQSDAALAATIANAKRSEDAADATRNDARAPTKAAAEAAFLNGDYVENWVVWVEKDETRDGEPAYYRADAVELTFLYSPASAKQVADVRQSVDATDFPIASFADLQTLTSAQVEVGRYIINRETGDRYRRADDGATDATLDYSGAGGLKFYTALAVPAIVKTGGIARTSQFGIVPGASSTLGAQIAKAMKSAHDTVKVLEIDTPGTYQVQDFNADDDLVRVESLSGLELRIGAGVRIASNFDIGATGQNAADGTVTNLFSFIDCEDIKVTSIGDGRIDVTVLNNAPAARITFAMLYFDAVTNGKNNNVKLHGLNAKIAGEAGFVYDGNYAGYLLRHRTAAGALRPTGFEAIGCDFSGSSGRIIQTVGAQDPIISRNRLLEVGADFDCVPIRTLGDSLRLKAELNTVKEAPNGYVTSGIVLGSLDTTRPGASADGLLTKNYVEVNGTTKAVSLHAGGNHKAISNVLVGDGTAGGRGINIEVTSEEIANGAPSSLGHVFTANIIRNFETPVLAVTPPAGGNITGLRYSKNEEINCGDINEQTHESCDLFEFGDGSFARGEVTAATATVTIDIPPFADKYGSYRLQIDDIFGSAFGSFDVALKTPEDVPANALNYYADRANLASSPPASTPVSGENVAAINFDQLSTSAGQLNSLTLDVKSREGRAYGSFVRENPVRIDRGGFRNDDQGQRLLRVEISRNGGGTIDNLQWRAIRLAKEI